VIQARSPVSGGLPARGERGPAGGMPDREVHDVVIRALADAPFRNSGEWRGLRLADPKRVERFARFLARHYYHQRIVTFFRYSRALAPVTGRRPERVPWTPSFDRLLPSVVLGSTETARQVATLVADHVRSGRTDPIPYLGDLLAYEAAMFVVEAGPRSWRGVGEHAPEGDLWVQAWDGVRLLDLSFDLPEVLPRLLGHWTEVPQPPRRPSRLVIARTARGRVGVARSTPQAERLLDLAARPTTTGELRRAAGLPDHSFREVLDGLLELGALRRLGAGGTEGTGERAGTSGNSLRRQRPR
jgi:hypothetical protein